MEKVKNRDFEVIFVLKPYYINLGLYTFQLEINYTEHSFNILEGFKNCR